MSSDLFIVLLSVGGLLLGLAIGYGLGFLSAKNKYKKEGVAL